MPIDMPAGHPGYVVHRHGFLAGGPQIQLGIAIQPQLGGGIFGAEVFFQRELRQQERDFLLAAILKLLQIVDDGIADDGRVLGFGRQFGSGKCEA